MSIRVLSGYRHELQYGRRAFPFNWRLLLAFAGNLVVWGGLAKLLWGLGS